MYFPIWNLPMHLRGSSMLQCYFKYFLGAYPREINMQDMHILRKYDSHANVLANFNYDKPYAAIFYCSKYLKYANGLLIHMPRLSIYRCLPWNVGINSSALFGIVQSIIFGHYFAMGWP